jgi:8-oxo-dGTP diphosphatase
MAMVFIDKLAFVYVQDEKVLMSRSRGKDTWYIPGGKREPGESDVEALIREVKEELDVHLIPETIRWYGVFEAQAHGKPEGVMVRMTCYVATFSGELQPSNEIESLAYLGYADKAMGAPVDYLIFDDLYARGLIAK